MQKSHFSKKYHRGFSKTKNMYFLTFKIIYIFGIMIYYLSKKKIIVFTGC